MADPTATIGRLYDQLGWELTGDAEMVMPGDNVDLVVTLITPVAMEEGGRFAIREGGKTVGAGSVVSIIE